MLTTVIRSRLLTLAALFVVFSLGLPASASAQSAPSRAAQNKQLIQRAFDQWAAGTGNFFDLLADDIEWTIAGSSPYSKTFTGKKPFLDQAAAPLTVRLSTPIVPKVRNLYADGDVVVAVWDGTATAKDGKPYRNTYSWVMTLQNGRITKALAFLDMAAYMDVINRIPVGK